MNTFSFVHRPKKILIVEDDDALRSALVQKLTKAGYTVIEASDGARAVQKVPEERPNIILLDLLLPKEDGMKTLEEIRADGYTMPVLIFTNMAVTAGLEEEARRLNAEVYQKASTTLEQIVERIKAKI